MQIDQNTHLTYCTNIHASEDWLGMWNSLKNYALPIKRQLAPGKKFGIGLWLSNRASRELIESGQLQEFKDWLQENDLYVFTCNAFPYGEFHRQVVKDQVHHPDWRTEERLAYTLRIIDILSELLPEGVEGGLSTSPLSYKPWLSSHEATEQAFNAATQNILKVADHLHSIYTEKGQLIHLDLEPEPDGLIENTREVIHYYQNQLLPAADKYFGNRIPRNEIAPLILRHIAICYDVCHFAVAYEEPEEAIAQLENQGIKIGKVQISAALKTQLPDDGQKRADLLRAFTQFDEPTYLHQVIARSSEGQLTQFPDLRPALEEINNPGYEEFRTHFHVPLFIDRYGLLESTQEDIKKTLDLYKSRIFTNHLEVETYTWEVLPSDLQLDLQRSIEREMNWVINHLD